MRPKRGIQMTAVIVAAVLLLTACATPRPTPSFTTPTVERDRANCLEAGGIWMETRTAYFCEPHPGRERT